MTPERLLYWAAKVEAAARLTPTPRLDEARTILVELRAPKDKP